MKTHYQLEGTPNSPVIVLSNSLGTDLTMWDKVVPELLPFFQVLRYDSRGHGKSDAPDGPYTVDQLGNDLLQLLDQLGFEKVSFCGISMGGQIGQWLGIHHGDRLHKLVISNTAAHIGTAAGWNQRIEAIKANGFSPLWATNQKVWLTDTFIKDNPALLEQLKVNS